MYETCTAAANSKAHQMGMPAISGEIREEAFGARGIVGSVGVGLDGDKQWRLGRIRISKPVRQGDGVVRAALVGWRHGPQDVVSGQAGGWYTNAALWGG